MGNISGARVLVTGADGFIGSHLVEQLVAEEAQVTAFCMYNSQGSYGWLDDVAEQPHLRRILGDIRDAEFVSRSVQEADVVFHLAALIGIPYSYAAPRSYVDTNVLGTLNVLEAVKQTGATMIHTSTSEVYGTPDSLPITEGHALKAQSPYSASKIGADKLCESYARSFGTRVFVLRPFNTFGPRQSMRAVIPTILGQLIGGASEIRLGSTSPRRDFTYVADTVDGFIRIATAADLDPGSVIHLGTGTDHSIGDVFDACCQAVGRRAVVSEDPERIRPAGSEVDILQSDPALAAAKLGWHAKVSLAEGLKLTAEWLLARQPDRGSGYRI